MIVNENHVKRGSLLIDDDGTIAAVMPSEDCPDGSSVTTSDDREIGEVVDAGGCYILPGIIDDHVHFREPGLTHKADIGSESAAAACGGVTSYLEMPNTVPQTTTLEALRRKFELAREKSIVNYSFFFGATNGNTVLFDRLDPHAIPGIKLFMGSSTGDMLVDSGPALDDIFRLSPLPVMVHCEDTAMINANMRRAKEQYGDDPDISFHPVIRSAEACYRSTAKAVALADRHHARLHVAHVSTARELNLFGDNPDITAEVTVGHLYFCDEDYARLGSRIKCNPAIKTAADREALRKALTDGRITVVGTDHAPHLPEEKEGGASTAASGMPMVQFSLVTMLELTDAGILPIERLVQLMCHNPARLFGIARRGFLRNGYKADIVVVRPDAPWTVTEDIIRSKCRWSPMQGHVFNWRVEHTFCNGHHVYDRGMLDTHVRGEALRFRE